MPQQIAHSTPGGGVYQFVRVRAIALRVLDDRFPTWWEVAVIDAVGNQHRILEKAPVLTKLDTDPGTWPLPLKLDAMAVRQEGATVRVMLLHGVETTDGRSVLEMARDDVEW